MSSLFGGSTAPSFVSPTVGAGTQEAFFNALFGSGIGQNPQGGPMFNQMPPYPGALSPDMSKTILPNVYNSWQPMDTGTMALANTVQNGSPQLNMLMNSQGAGPGTAAQKNIKEYGSASQPVGNMMHSLAQYGAAGPAGIPLNAIAQGQMSGPAQYMAPFLNRGMSNPYQAPSIPYMPTQQNVVYPPTGAH